MSKSSEKSKNSAARLSENDLRVYVELKRHHENLLNQRINIFLLCQFLVLLSFLGTEMHAVVHFVVGGLGFMLSVVFFFIITSRPKTLVDEVFVLWASQGEIAPIQRNLTDLKVPARTFLFIIAVTLILVWCALIVFAALGWV